MSRPCPSTVKPTVWVGSSPYVPGVTAVLASEIVPVVVMGPPARPVPVATLVTVPLVALKATSMFAPSERMMEKEPCETTHPASPESVRNVTL